MKKLHWRLTPEREVQKVQLTNFRYSLIISNYEFHVIILIKLLLPFMKRQVNRGKGENNTKGKKKGMAWEAGGQERVPKNCSSILTRPVSTLHPLSSLWKSFAFQKLLLWHPAQKKTIFFVSSSQDLIGNNPQILQSPNFKSILPSWLILQIFLLLPDPD